MTNFKLGTFGLLVVCVASFGLAGAQSVRHDKMDARAAKADIIRLQAERRQAKIDHNWGKVAQDDRLIAADKHFLKKDVRKVKQAGG